MCQLKNLNEIQETDKSNSINSHSSASYIDLSLIPTNENLVISTEQDDNYVKGWARSLTILHHGHWYAARKYERIYLRLG